MDLVNILLRDDVPTDVKNLVTNLKGQLEICRNQIVELRENEEKYKMIFDSAPNIIVLIDTFGRIIDCNNAAGRLSGLSKEELLGKHFSETGVVLEEDTQLYSQLLKEISTGTEISSIEVKTVDAEGTIHYLELSPSLLMKNGKLQAIQIIIHDITEKKQAEENLLESEKRFRELAELLPEIIFETDEKMNLTFSNRIAFEKFGYTQQDFTNGLNIFQMICPEQREKVAKEISRLFNGEKIGGREYIALRKDGSTFPIMIYSSLIHENEPVGLRGIIVDMTKKKQIEDVIRKERDLVQQYIDMSGGIMFALNLQGEITLINRMGRKILGYSKEQILGRNWFDNFIPERIRDRLQIIFNAFIAGKTRNELETLRESLLGPDFDFSVNPILTKSGDERLIIWANSIIKDEVGNITGIISSGQDITERKQTEELMKVQRDLGIALSATADLAEALELILDAALKVIGIDSGGIYLVDKETGDLYLAHYKGFPEDFAAYVSVIKAEDPRTKLVMKGKPVFGPHKQVVPSVDTTRLKEGILSLGVIPVLFEDKVVAALNVASHSIEKISNHAKNTLETIATQIGSTLELKEAEEVLRESKEKYQMLVEKLEEGVLLEDVEGNVSFVNPKAAEMLGAPVEEILGQHWTKLVPPSSLDVALAESKRRMRGISSSYEINLQSKDGSFIPVIVSASPIFSSEGEFYGVISVFTDITERIRAEEEIKKERDLAQKYLDTAGVIMLAIEANQGVSLINKKGCEILRYDEKEIIGKNWFDNFIPKRLRDEVKKVFEKLMSGEVEPDEYFENPIVTSDGEEKIIAWHNTILKDKEGKITGILSSGEDISERVKAERIRKELEERRENFIYMTTHELRTPLTVIGGYCDFLSEHDEFIDHPRREKIYSILRSNVNRLERLTRDVSHIVQLERGELFFEKKEVNIYSFLKSILEPYGHLLGSQFSFQYYPEEPSVIVQADPDRLQQVMENIISNAIKHTPKDKRQIGVSMESSVDKIRILITDNGAGIAPEHLETIFEQFITIPTDYTAIGTGIGLYLSREIIKAHEGTITAQSEGKGRGSTFIIEIPREIA
ncbi:MAG: PAS domain S-box protein [Candidatus Hodarchaeota archaeon]